MFRARAEALCRRFARPPMKVLLRNRAQLSSCAVLPETPSFAFGRAAPDTELLLVIQRVFEALRAHLTVLTHLSCSFGGTAALGKEDLWIDLCATGVGLPLNGL